MRSTLYSLLCFFLLSFCATEAIGQHRCDSLLVVSYNVENLFDTRDDPNTRDDDFTPEGVMEWTNSRYFNKIHKLSAAISRIGGWEWPTLVALIEVENDSVLYRLCHHTDLRNRGYEYFITHGSDPRGINVGLLYDPYLFRSTECLEWSVQLPNYPELRTRNLLYTRGYLANDALLHVIVCHLPSNRGGKRKTDPYRAGIMQIIKQKTDSLQLLDPKANILVMGDFNATPDDPLTDPWVISYKEASNNSAISPPFSGRENVCVGNRVPENFSAPLLDEPEGEILSQTSLPPFVELLSSIPRHSPRGSYIFRGIWTQIDRILVSYPLLNGVGQVIYRSDSAQNVALPEYSKKNVQGEWIPKRTYGGHTYLQGLSDHFPVMARFHLLYSH